VGYQLKEAQMLGLTSNSKVGWDKARIPAFVRHSLQTA